MIWLAERIAALVVVIIGNQILFNPLRGSRSKRAHGTYSARSLCSRFVDPDRMDALAPGLAKTAHGPIVSFCDTVSPRCEPHNENTVVNLGCAIPEAHCGSAKGLRRRAGGALER